MKSFEDLNQIEEMPEYDKHLETLWGYYNFEGNPPKANTSAEKRLRDACERYSNYILFPSNLLHNRNDLSKEITKKSDSQRRLLHNEIAVMTVGAERSGMDIKSARHIANFAMEYIKGFTVDDLENGVVENSN